MAIPIGYAGRGSQLMCSLDGINFTAVAQLQSFEPSGSKQTVVDQTNLLSPGNFTVALAVKVDSGEIDFAGILNAYDPTFVTLAQLHAALTLAYWRVTLIDGSQFTFQAFISEFKPFGVKITKLNTFSGKLRLAGAMQSTAIGSF
jgi:hypothetical protein